MTYTLVAANGQGELGGQEQSEAVADVIADGTRVAVNPGCCHVGEAGPRAIVVRMICFIPVW